MSDQLICPSEPGPLQLRANGPYNIDALSPIDFHGIVPHNFPYVPGSGSVTNVSVTTANGLGGTVANPTSTPAISLSLNPSVTGILKGTGTGITQATAGTDYLTSPVDLTSQVTNVLPLSNGGTGASTATGALNAIAPSNAMNLGYILTSTIAGTGFVPVVGVQHGGTAQTSLQASMNALAGAVTAGEYLRGDGTNVTMSAIQSTDVPTLNQNTTGTAAGLSSTLVVGSGGTGATTLTGLVKGNGTSAFTAAMAGTDYVIPSGSISGTSGNVTGVVAVANGGTNSSTALANGKVMVSAGGEIVEQSSAITVANGGTGASSLASNGLLYGNGTSAVGAMSALSNGQLAIGSSGNAPVAATLTAGSGVSIANAAGSITISATGSGGSVTNVSVVNANGFNGSVATSTTTPAITLSTTVTGVVKGNGTSISAAAAGTDYVAPGGPLGTPSSGTLTNCTGLPASSVTGQVAVANGGTGTNNGSITPPTTNSSTLGSSSVAYQSVTTRTVQSDTGQNLVLQALGSGLLSPMNSMLFCAYVTAASTTLTGNAWNYLPACTALHQGLPSSSFSLGGTYPPGLWNAPLSGMYLITVYVPVTGANIVLGLTSQSGGQGASPAFSNSITYQVSDSAFSAAVYVNATAGIYPMIYNVGSLGGSVIGALPPFALSTSGGGAWFSISYLGT